jgi:hypothetical protein
MLREKKRKRRGHPMILFFYRIEDQSHKKHITGDPN